MSAVGIAPNYAVHPGTMLEEWLEENRMSQTEFALRIGRSVKNVNQIVNGVADVSPDLALGLETVTGVPARLWLNMQAQYDADVARIRRDELLRDSVAWLDNLPVGDLRRRGYIAATARDKLTQVSECLRFFGVSSVDAWNAVWLEPEAQFRQSGAYEAHTGAIAAWLRLGELESQQIEPQPFSRARLEEGLPLIRALTREPQGSKIIPRLLRLAEENGVVLLFIPDVSGTRLYGATRWRHGNPVIQMSLRRKTDDQFWFTLFHELAHVLLHGRDRLFLDGSDSRGTTEEQEADEFSCDLLIPKDRVSELAGLRSLDDVDRFAAEIGVSSGVVVGRMQHDGLRNYNWGTRLKRTVAFAEAA